MILRIFLHIIYTISYSGYYLPFKPFNGPSPIANILLHSYIRYTYFVAYPADFLIIILRILQITLIFAAYLSTFCISNLL
jgi:hypothetical protein